MPGSQPGHRGSNPRADTNPMLGWLESVDTADLKSAAPLRAWEFESLSEHYTGIAIAGKQQSYKLSKDGFDSLFRYFFCPYRLAE